MTINEIARITVIAESALSELTTMSAMDRMEFLAAFQSRLILSFLHESDAGTPSSPDSRRPALSALEGSERGFSLRALTPRAVPMVEAIDKVLARLPHGEGI